MGTSPDDVILCRSAGVQGGKSRPDRLGHLARRQRSSVTCERFTVEDFKPFDPVAQAHRGDDQVGRRKALPRHEGSAAGRVGAGRRRRLGEGAGEPSDRCLRAKGYRALGVARSDGDGGGWKFLGVISLSDPPRDDSKATIHAAREMGARVKMVTGDQVAIAVEIARQLDLGTNILDAASLDETAGRPLRKSRTTDRRRGRFRAGLSRAQISHRRGPPEARPHRRHDWRRRERLPGAEKGRRRHRGFGRDRRGPCRRRHRVYSPRACRSWSTRCRRAAAFFSA